MVLHVFSEAEFAACKVSFYQFQQFDDLSVVHTCLLGLNLANNNHHRRENGTAFDFGFAQQ